jgi:hypothetical protein
MLSAIHGQEGADGFEELRLVETFTTKAHADKYGYGQRTLTLYPVPSSVSVANSQVKYTVRLSILPRSMLYSSKDFAVRRHASFRTTTVQTTGEHTLSLFDDSDFTCINGNMCVFTPLRTLLVSLCLLDQADGW